jgi:hypothetical protein
MSKGGMSGAGARDLSFGRCQSCRIGASPALTTRLPVSASTGTEASAVVAGRPPERTRSECEAEVRETGERVANVAASSLKAEVSGCGAVDRRGFVTARLRGWRDELLGAATRQGPWGRCRCSARDARCGARGRGCALGR